MKMRIPHVFFVVLAVSALAACASGRTEIESDLGIDGAPDWVNEGSQALNNRDGRLIHGMGSAPKMSSQSLQISTADNRARAEVARVLSSFMHVVSADYVATTGAGESALDEQAISRSVENVTRLNMSGAEIIGHWRDPETGAVYSLAELDLRRVAKLVGSTNEMHGGLRNHFAEHGETLFDEFVEEK